MAVDPSIGRAENVDRPVADAATRSLYERFAGQIYGYCLHQLGSREEAEDAAQTTFMNAFRGLKRGIIPEVESAWLFKIAHNVCLSRRRSSWRRGRVEAPNNLEMLQEVVPARERSRDELIRLQDVLEAMPESQRRAILLREWQGLSYREIAEELELSQAAVETLIFRARRALAAGLEETARVEQQSWRRRAQRSLDAGGIVAALKALLTGGTAVKIAATTVAVATTAAMASSEIDRHHAAAVVPKTPPTTARVTRTLPFTAPAREAHAAMQPAQHVAAPVRQTARPARAPRTAFAPRHTAPAPARPAVSAVPPVHTEPPAEPPKASEPARPAPVEKPAPQEKTPPGNTNDKPKTGDGDAPQPVPPTGDKPPETTVPVVPPGDTSAKTGKDTLPPHN